MALPAPADVTPDEQGDTAIFRAFEDLERLISEEDDETMATCIHGRLLRGILEYLSRNPSPAGLQQLASYVDGRLYLHGIGVKLAALLRRASASAISRDAVKLYVSAAIDRIRLGEQTASVADGLEWIFGDDLSRLAKVVKSA